ncbi:NDP-hexose 2,3-dehydratase family protein [uncultured Rubinisphaera sp.]|uniref:NDP-hexose 2,3-dehydratase family protein n=1 Tax=uncultured Rubinisphaera sp. TaxID=1678686 RepID=UPI0030DD1390
MKMAFKNMASSSELDLGWSVKQLLDWREVESNRSRLQVQGIKLSQSGEWQLDSTGSISHHSQRYFRMVGMNYFDIPRKQRLTQPMIDQPEVGMLCFLVSRQFGGWKILLQAKAEPGNVNGVQFAPSIQATCSNYQRVHQGEPVPYLDYALKSDFRLYDQLQSEQNSRFLCKRNCNRVVKVSETFPTADTAYQWVPLNQLFPVLAQSHVINTDARSVLACWLLSNPDILSKSKLRQGELQLLNSLVADRPLHDSGDLQHWLDSLNAKWKLDRQQIPITELGGSWNWDDGNLTSHNHAFSVRQIAVQCQTRENPAWDQPIIAANKPTNLTTVVSMINGSLHLLLQARLEAGNRDGFELTTTIQAESIEAQSVEESKYAENLPSVTTSLLRFANSEEGGRFDQCISEYEILWAEANDVLESPFHRWVSLSQISGWLKKTNFITNELRSTLSALLAIEFSDA